MSTTHFKDSLLRNDKIDELRDSSNAGLKFAVILAFALTVITVAWLALAAPTAKSVSSTPHTTVLNGITVQSKNDKSFVDGQSVQGTAPSPLVKY